LKNYYRILNLKPEATQAEIKKTYRQLAVKYHPDKNGGDSSSEERFKEIAEAYLILGDTAKRNAYDFSKGYKSSFRDSSVQSGTQTAATFLILFKKIKERVLHAGGRVNQEALFRVIDDLLTDENINFLIDCGDTATTGLIIDDILSSCIFLGDSKRGVIHSKLFRLADGNTWFIGKIDTLKEKSLVGDYKSEPETAENPTAISIIIFILALLLFAFMVFA
jgi:molecular chaperone DnaJ